MEKLKHFPVTVSYWRGVWDRPRGTLRAACHWNPILPQDADYEFPTCDGCVAYKEVLRKFNKLRPW